jgi:hypothetical protein
MLDRLNDTISKKVDNDYLRSQNSLMKSEVMQKFEILKSDINLENASKNSKL